MNFPASILDNLYIIARFCVSVCLSVWLSVCDEKVTKYFLGGAKIILASGEIISGGAKIILASGKIILGGAKIILESGKII